MNKHDDDARSCLQFKHAHVLVLVLVVPPLLRLELLALLLLLLPVHSVCKLNLPKSYGAVALVLVVVVFVDLSFSLNNEAFLFRSHFLRDVFIKRVSTATHITTNKAPINEPNKVCFISIELKNVISDRF